MKLFIAALATETNTFSPLPTGRAGFMNANTSATTAAAIRPARQHPADRVAPPWGRREGHEVAESICDLRPARRHDPAARLRGAARHAAGRSAGRRCRWTSCCSSCTAPWWPMATTTARATRSPASARSSGRTPDRHRARPALPPDGADAGQRRRDHHLQGIPAHRHGGRARELYALCTARAAGRGEAGHGLSRLPHGEHVAHAASSRCGPSSARMQALEGQDGILSVSFGHGFPWGDVADVGRQDLVVADGDAAKAAALARHTRTARSGPCAQADPSPHDTIDEASTPRWPAPAGPLVLADVADNAGGGAPSDNTAILRRLVERGVRDAAIGCFWDPVAVQICSEAGDRRQLRPADRRQVRRRVRRCRSTCGSRCAALRTTTRRPA